MYWAIPAACRPLLHPCSPKSYCILYPRSYWGTPPLDPPALCDLPQASHQYCCRLDWQSNSLPTLIQSFLLAMSGLTWFSTVHLISATNTVLIAITNKGFRDATPTKSTNPPKGAGNLPTFTACVQKIAFSWGYPCFPGLLTVCLLISHVVYTTQNVLIQQKLVQLE